MKFNLGEKIRLRSTGRLGEIIHCKHEKYIYNGKITESKRYEVHFGSYDRRWYFEQDLVSDYEFDNKFEIELCDLLINVYLRNKKYDLVKKLYNEKQNYMRKC
jgi:hypothetical protein